MQKQLQNEFIEQWQASLSDSLELNLSGTHIFKYNFPVGEKKYRNYDGNKAPRFTNQFGLNVTYDLIKLPWLQIRDPAMEHDFKLAIFTSK